MSLLLAVSGWRSGEARHLKWSELDLDRRLATPGDTKSGLSVRPPSMAAIEIIQRQPRKGDFVFDYRNGEPINKLSHHWVYRTRFFGQTVGLCGAPERLVMPSGASVVRASVAVLLDQPFGVVAGGEGADGVSDVVDGLEDTSVHDLLLEGSEQALDDAIGLRLSDEGVARRDAPGADLFLESVRHEVAAVIMPQRQAAGGAGVDAVELVSHCHADGLKSFEAGPALGDMPTEQLGVPVLGDAEQPDLAVLDGNDLGRVGRPHHVRRLGDDPPIVRRVGARASAMGRQQAMLAHEPQQAFA